EALCPRRVGVVPAHARRRRRASPGGRTRRGHEADRSTGRDRTADRPAIPARPRPTAGPRPRKRPWPRTDPARAAAAMAGPTRRTPHGPAAIGNRPAARTDRDAAAARSSTHLHDVTVTLLLREDRQ